MIDRLTHLSPLLRVALVAVSALGVLGLGIVLATGAMRGEVTRTSGGAKPDPATADIPPMDRQAPERLETATFAMG